MQINNVSQNMDVYKINPVQNWKNPEETMEINQEPVEEAVQANTFTRTAENQLGLGNKIDLMA